MGDVISLVRPPKDGEGLVLECHCGEPFTVIAVKGTPPFISELICESCDNSFEVEDGFIVGMEVSWQK